MSAPAAIHRLTSSQVRAGAPQLAQVLRDAVDDGASLGFLADATTEELTAYWTGIADKEAGRAVLAAADEQGIAGCVVMAPAMTAFQPHRADIFKLAVHRRARGRGLAKALMDAAEVHALRADRWMLSLMTRKGGDAEHLYRKLGWSLAGVIPDDSVTPGGQLCDAAIYVKRLR